MKRFFRGIGPITLSLSMVLTVTGCQEQEQVKATPISEVSVPASPVDTESKVEPAPAKPVEQHKQEEKKTEPKVTEVKQEPVAKPASEPAPKAKPVQAPTIPVQTPASTAVPKPSVPVKSEPAPKPVKQQIVTLSITGDEQVGTILSATEVVLEEGDTVLGVLKTAAKEKKIQMEYRGTGAVSYVEGIDNLYEFDRGPKSGWVYRVNGVMGKRSAGDMVLKPNDRIEWLYTLNLGKDLE